MNNITPVCGFKDSNGRFWETQDEAEEFNYQIEITDLVNKITDKIKSFHGKHEYDDRYYEYRFFVDFPRYFKRLVLSEPNLVLSVIWKIIKHDFKKKWETGQKPY